MKAFFDSYANTIRRVSTMTKTTILGVCLLCCWSMDATRLASARLAPAVWRRLRSETGQLTISRTAAFMPWPGFAEPGRAECAAVKVGATFPLDRGAC